MRFFRRFILCLMLVLSLVMAAHAISADHKTNIRVAKSYGMLPLSFAENKGQMDKRARFVIRGPRASAFFRNDGVTFDLWDASKKKPSGKQEMLQTSEPMKVTKSEKRRHAVLKLTFKGANPSCRVEGIDTLPGRVNYMKGKDSSKWHTDIPTYKGVVYRNAWQGIDIIYRGDQRQLKYDIRVNPGADISRVQFRYDGIRRMRLDRKGALHIKTSVTEFIERVPGIYQLKSGRKISVSGGYRIIDGRTVGFSVKDADPSLPLVIDPASDLAYSTFLGGSDTAYDIAVDSSGCAYVTGSTQSSDFPATPGAFDTSYNIGEEGAYDAFVTKLNPSGSELVYSTFLGGEEGDYGKSISVDSSGCAYMAGYTWSYDFPTTSGAFDTTRNGGVDTVVVKLNPSGSGLAYSTFVGGGGADFVRGMAVDLYGCAYVTGSTDSSDFPTTTGAFDVSHNAGFDNAFITKLNSAGTELAYSTYLDGGVGEDIAVDSSGSAYVTGEARGFSNFPTTAEAFSTSFGGGVLDAFIAKFDPSGSSLEYSTFLGEEGNDCGFGIAVDSSGYAYATGWTDSADFPTTPGSFSRSLHGTKDAFVTRLDPSGSTLTYSTFLGGSDVDCGSGITVDSSGRAFVAGYTASPDFPTTSEAFNRSYGGRNDVFASRLDLSGSSIDYSTFLGGINDDCGYGIAVGLSGSVYLTGTTNSADFPTTPGAFHGSLDPNGDIFIAKVDVGRRKIDLLIKAGAESTYSGTDLFSTDGTNQMKSQNAAPGQKITYAFKVKNIGDANDSFKITGPAGGIGWSVRYYDLITGAEITSQVTGAGWPSGALVPGASKGIFVKITPNASLPAGSVNTLLIAAASETDSSAVDVVKAVTTFVGSYKTDMILKAGSETKYTGTGIFNTDGTGQTKALNVSAGQKVTYTFRAQNAGNANDSFRIVGTPGGSGWSVKYYDIATNVEVTSQVTGSGWVSGTVAPKGYPGVYANVKPDATVPLGSTITLTITGSSESDNTKTDVVKSVTTCVASYKPDMSIKNGVDASYIGNGVFNTDGTDQTKSQNASAGVKVTYSFRVMNAGNLSDSIKITGTSGGSGWSVKYYDLASVDITSQVTGSGWSSGILAPGADRGFFVKVSPDVTVGSGASKTLLITAASVGSGTKTDTVKAVTTVP